MKALITLLLFITCLTSQAESKHHTTPPKKETYVYVGDSNTSVAYHVS